MNDEYFAHNGKCFNCDKEVTKDYYCHNCGSYVCEDCEAGFSIAASFAGSEHYPENHLKDYDGEDL